MILLISALALARLARDPVILHCLYGPVSSGPVMNCTLAPVSDSTRLKFSPSLPMIKPTRLDSIEMDSTLSSPPLAGDRSRGAYPPPPWGGEKAPAEPLPLSPGENERSRYSRPGGGRSPRRSSRYGLKLSRKASRRAGGDLDRDLEDLYARPPARRGSWAP